jgi:hypothetical protein
MAIAKVADRGSIATNTAGATPAVDLAAGASITVGNYLIARIAGENTGGGGAARTLNSVTDPAGNTWTIAATVNRDPGAAGDGTTSWCVYAKVATGYSNGADLTFNFSGTLRAAIVVEEWSGIHATTPEVGTEATAADVSSAGGALVAALARTPAASGQLVYGVVGWEGPNGDSYTEDADTTDGSWVALTKLGTTNGIATDNECIAGGYKIVTGTTAQSWAPTIGVSRDYGALLVVFDEAVANTNLVVADCSHDHTVDTVTITHIIGLAPADAAHSHTADNVVVTTAGFATPTGLTATAVSTSQIDVSWDAVPGATGYDLERDGAIIVANHGSTSYSDTGLSSATEYTYRVRARQVAA